jgi:hypothetical protein
MTENEMLGFKIITRLKKDCKNLREQLRIATNVLRADSKHDNTDYLQNMRKCLEDTKFYYRGTHLTDEDRKMFADYVKMVTPLLDALTEQGKEE